MFFVPLCNEMLIYANCLWYLWSCLWFCGLCVPAVLRFIYVCPLCGVIFAVNVCPLYGLLALSVLMMVLLYLSCSS